MNTEQQQLFHPSFGLGQYQEQVNAKVIPLFRNSDPASSKAASVGASKRRPSQQVVLLKAYAINAIHGHKGLTDEMAGIYTNLAGKPGCCYWKRCSELRAKGYIKPTGEHSLSRAGEMQMVCQITLEGATFLTSLGT
jgi:hypothetical protein